MADDEVGTSPDDLEELCDCYEDAMEDALEALGRGDTAGAEMILRDALEGPEDEDDDEEDDDE